MRDEVRQVTLLDMQSARVSNLIEEPAFDAVWFERLAAELQNLDAVDDTNATLSLYRRQAAEVTADAIHGAEKVETAERYFLDAQLLASAEILEKALVERLVREMERALTELNGGDAEMVVSVAHQLAYLQGISDRVGALLSSAQAGVLANERNVLLEALTSAGLQLHKQGN